ncbi:hypothetical protein CEXT_333511 [Caerostris extrusa]|uniref:Uncharacterized protein n=1 Tax=Caerostris extrusa TaxID=172846 RepID=A0AAV4RVX8_CAEEX|nr:hypothetical protein CEXT_333511 [Caerostris extrusa]
MQSPVRFITPLFYSKFMTRLLASIAETVPRDDSMINCANSSGSQRRKISAVSPCLTLCSFQQHPEACFATFLFNFRLVANSFPFLKPPPHCPCSDSICFFYLIDSK